MINMLGFIVCDKGMIVRVSYLQLVTKGEQEAAVTHCGDIAVT